MMSLIRLSKVLPGNLHLLLKLSRMMFNNSLLTLALGSDEKLALHHVQNSLLGLALGSDMRLALCSSST